MKFNGINPRDISPRISIEREIVGSIPPRSLQMLSLNGGAGYVGMTYEPRPFTARINIGAWTRPGCWELAQRLSDWACTDEPCELEPTHAPGRAFTAILDSASDLQNVRGFAVIDYHFTIPRPFYHSIVENVVVMPGGGRIHFRGNVPAQLSITHRMAKAAQALTISHNGTPFVRLRRQDGENIPAGVTLRVDMANKLIQYNGEADQDLVDYTAMNWRQRICGAADISVSDEGHTEIRWRDEWT